MSVWYAMPSAASAPGASRCLGVWQTMGYRVAVARECDDALVPVADFHVQPASYRGYQATVNQLCAAILERDPDTALIVAGADDVFPDGTKRADEIAGEFVEHFGGTLGVMQPTGHSSWSAKATRIAWSPWLGREWCRRAYQGKGPFPEGYYHLRADIELCMVAKRLDVWWARPDLTQRHERHQAGAPHRSHIDAHVPSDAALFESRRRLGFPGSDLAAA